METKLLAAIDNMRQVQEPRQEVTGEVSTRVRWWLEVAWRHGEIVNDDDSLETQLSARPFNRFTVSDEAADETR